ncbi:MAG TPA: DUF362 domain-containing protein [Prolixibacteraceae bacterium]|nr:DUF362 domain-containing protein [Prolixibacteraceae bacterium]
MKTKVTNFISRFWFKISFIVLGIASLTWFLIRVIPKPSRAQYPCMKAAFPIASSFVSYILGISVFALLIKKAKQRFMQSKYLIAAGFLLTGLLAGVWGLLHTDSKSFAGVQLSGPQPVNQPIGEGKGIFPGRVVWVHDTDATNENCSNSNNNYWYMSKNTNQTVVNNMLAASVQQLTGTTSNADAWDKIIRYYNQTHNRGDKGYTAGEKIVIKINLNGQNGGWPQDKNINTSPQICMAVLDHLVNVVGVAQSDISIGDPNINMNDDMFEMLDAQFPNVTYWGTRSGRSQVHKSAQPVLISSDGVNSDYLPQEYLDAAYMINIPVFKKHHRAGISICSKNHFGSITPFTSGAWHWHYSLPCPEATGEDANGLYGSYRCFVDIMGHKDLGGKTILYLVDGLWGSINWGHPPVKWAMTPFNKDYPNSLFVSLDPVAIESVCYDFLYEEFDENHPTEGVFVGDDKGPFPHFEGTDDFLHQSADPSNWPATIQYDPENDGTVLASMGTHEHWNNATEKKYTRNLSPDGKGIELFRANSLSVEKNIRKQAPVASSAYPNPARDYTNIHFTLVSPATVSLTISNLKGQVVYSASMGKLEPGEHLHNWNIAETGGNVSSGIYTYALRMESREGSFWVSNKLSVVK